MIREESASGHVVPGSFRHVDKLPHLEVDDKTHEGLRQIVIGTQSQETVTSIFSKFKGEETVLLQEMVWKKCRTKEAKLKMMLHAWLKHLLPPICTIEAEYAIEEGVYADLVVKSNDRVSCIIEVKKRFSKFGLQDQLVRYATCLLRDNPGVNSFGMILTNGKDYIVGQAGWDSRGSTEFLFEKTVKQLGKDTISFWTAAASIADNCTVFDVVGVRFRGDRLYTKLVLEKVIGRGACSTVFRGRVTFGDESRLGKKYAVKVGLTMYIQRELKMKQLIEEKFPAENEEDRITLPYLAYHYGTIESIVVYDLAFPVVKSPWTPVNMVADLTRKHLLMIWKKLSLLHSAGIIHRDVRQNNIVILDDVAYFIDFGSSVGVDDCVRHEGTEVTASQRLLKLLSNNPVGIFNYVFKDDIDSFFKTFNMCNYGIAIPPPSKKETKEEFYSRLLRDIGRINVKHSKGSLPKRTWRISLPLLRST